MDIKVRLLTERWLTQTQLMCASALETPTYTLVVTLLSCRGRKYNHQLIYNPKCVENMENHCIPNRKVPIRLNQTCSDKVDISDLWRFCSQTCLKTHFVDWNFTIFRNCTLNTYIPNYFKVIWPKCAAFNLDSVSCSEASQQRAPQLHSQTSSWSLSWYWSWFEMFIPFSFLTGFCKCSV